MNYLFNLIYMIIGVVIFLLGFKIGKGENIELPKIKRHRETKETTEETKIRQGISNMRSYLNKKPYER